MGTTYHIKLVKGLSATGIEDLKNKIDTLLIAFNQKMSTYIPTSEISRFNKYSANSWFTVSDDFLYLIKRSKEISELTGGAFDITVGALVNLWGFGAKHRKDEIPSKSDILELKEKIGYRQLHFDIGKIKKNDQQIYLDFAAIAKGYGVDKVSNFLRDQGYSDHMVEIGGEVRIEGLKNGDRKWNIAIESPVSNVRTIDRVISLTNKSMATSGDYRNYFEKDGKRYSHTIDPRTGMPIIHRLAAVTVIQKRCIDADALATAMMVLGDIAGPKFAKEHKIAALFFVKTSNGFKEIVSQEFSKLLKVEK